MVTVDAAVDADVAVDVDVAVAVGAASDTADGNSSVTAGGGCEALYTWGCGDYGVLGHGR